MAKKSLITNLDTGEQFIAEEIEQEKNYSRKYGRWLVLNQKALAQLACDPEITKDAYRVFLQLLGKLAKKNWVTVNQTRLSEQMGIKRPNISTALKLLVNKKVLTRHPENPCLFRLNDFYGYKGSLKDLDDTDTAI